MVAYHKCSRRHYRVRNLLPPNNSRNLQNFSELGLERRTDDDRYREPFCSASPCNLFNAISKTVQSEIFVVSFIKYNYDAKHFNLTATNDLPSGSETGLERSGA